KTDHLRAGRDIADGPAVFPVLKAGSERSEAQAEGGIAMALNHFRDSSSLGFIDWTLRGIGQVVFQNNPWAGLVILLGILFNSWIYAAICVVGVVASTLTAVILKADRGLIRDGL